MIKDEILDPKTFITLTSYTSVTKAHPTLANDPRFATFLVENVGTIGGNFKSKGGFKFATNSSTDSTFFMDADGEGNSIIESNGRSVTTLI